jgi:hypothetical protein
MFIFSVIALGGLFLVNILFGMKLGFGFRHYWFFELEHFLGGFFVAMFLSNFTDSAVLIFIGLAAVTFLWEFAEYLIARFRKTAAPGWKDTMLDIFLNFLGATIFILLKN